MPQLPSHAPDALVMGAGGTVGIAWLRGVLAGVQEAGGFDAREAGCLVGTSAGSVVAAALAAGVAPSARAAAAEAPDAAAVEAEDDASVPAAPRLLTGAARLTRTAVAPVAPLALALAAPGGALARAAALSAVPRGRRPLSDLRAHVRRLGPAFDGRLRVVALDRRTGRRVVFGAPGAPRADVDAAVAASCAVPGLFAPVRIEGREYVDGGVWSLSNVDVADGGRGAQVVALLPMGGPVRVRGIGALTAAARAATFAEVQALRGRGARVHLIAPDARAAGAMGPNLMDRRRQDAAFRAGRAQGRALARSPAAAA